MPVAVVWRVTGQLTVSGRSLDFPRDSLVHASDVTLNVTPGFTETRAQAKFSADEEIVSQREAVWLSSV